MSEVHILAIDLAKRSSQVAPRIEAGQFNDVNTQTLLKGYW